MALATEIKGSRPSKVLQYTIPTQILEEGVVTQRVSTQHSLSYPFIERNMSPNKVAEIRPGGRRWVLIAPHGGYTPTEHLMAMRWEADYTPDPESVPVQEGEELMKIFADLARGIFGRPDNQKCIFGYHSSPDSFLQAGYQSVPTMFHPYIFGLPNFTGEENPYMSLVDIRELTRQERRAIRGGNYNRKFGRFLVDHALNGQFRGDGSLLNQLFDMGQAEVDLRGVRVPTRGTLEETLRTPGIFDRFLQPFAINMNQYAEDLSTAITDFNPKYVRARIEEIVLSRREPEDEATQTVLADISRRPQLLERPQRTQNIQSLKEKGYSDEFVRYLQDVSDRILPDSGPATEWKRGFAYIFALCQDNVTGQGFMAISVGVEDGPGGVVESVLGAKLVRPSSPFSREQMQERRTIYNELVASLNGCVVRD